MKRLYGVIVLAAVIIGILFNLPSLDIGASFDDYYHQAFIEAHLKSSRDFPSMPRKWWDLFNYCGPGGKEEVHRGVSMGKYPWWIYPELRLAFFRPLSALSHYFDYIVWPKRFSLMHAHNILWYIGILIVLGVYYRRMAPVGWVAGLALLFYCVDEARVESVGWIASRNTLMTAFFCIVTLISYDKWRRDGWRWGSIATPVLYVIAHLCSEGAWGLWAYFIAYAWFLDRTTPVRRLISLLPMFLISVVWRSVYNAFGYGTYATFYYFDPINSLMRYLGELPERLLICFGELFYFFPRNAYFGGVDAGSDYDFILFILSLLIIPTAWVFFSMMRSSREARYWLASAFLICVPLSTVYPMPRLFLVASISGCPLMAQAIAFSVGYFRRSEGSTPRPLWRIVAARFTQLLTVLLAVFWLGLHLVAAPFFAIQRSDALRSILHYGEAHADLIPSGPEISRKTMVIINTPDLYPTLFSLTRRKDGAPIYPQPSIIIGETTNAFIIRRESKTTLSIRLNKGFFQSPYSLFIRDSIFPIPNGYRVKQLDFLITVEQITEDGRPIIVRIDHPDPDATNLIWVVWNGQKFSRISLPPIGRSYGYPAVNWHEYKRVHKML
jgi:hypothetical protein